MKGAALVALFSASLAMAEPSEGIWRSPSPVERTLPAWVDRLASPAAAPVQVDRKIKFPDTSGFLVGKPHPNRNLVFCIIENDQGKKINSWCDL